MDSNIRPSWEEYFKTIVENTAKRSSCHRLQVGCLLVRDNRIISQGYNGFLPGTPHESIVENNHEQATVHAEQNAIANCARRGISVNGAEIYITHFPCINCFKIICASGIKQIKYSEDYKNSDVVKQLLKSNNISIIKL